MKLTVKILKKLIKEEMRSLIKEEEDYLGMSMVLFGVDPSEAFQLLSNLPEYGILDVENFEEPDRIKPTVKIKFSSRKEALGFRNLLQTKYHDKLFENPDLSTYSVQGNDLVFKFSQKTEKPNTAKYY
jgi:hypothetical protein